MLETLIQWEALAIHEPWRRNYWETLQEVVIYQTHVFLVSSFIAVCCWQRLPILAVCCWQRLPILAVCCWQRLPILVERNLWTPNLYIIYCFTCGIHTVFVWIEHFSFTYTGPPIVRCIWFKQPDVCSNAFLFSFEGSLECTMSHPSIFTFILGPPLWRHCFWCYRFMYVYVQMKWYINLG